MKNALRVFVVMVLFLAGTVIALPAVAHDMWMGAIALWVGLGL